MEAEMRSFRSPLIIKERLSKVTFPAEQNVKKVEKKKRSSGMSFMFLCAENYCICMRFMKKWRPKDMR